MSKELRLGEKAVDDLRSAFLWYERRRVGLGEEFLQHNAESFESIRLMPESFPFLMPGIRRGISKRFPCLILYREEHAAVIVLGVFHASRNPRIWKSRIREG